MTGAETVAAIGAVGAIGGGLAASRHAGGGGIPSFYSRTAGPIATDMRRALSMTPGDFQFDPAGNLISSRYGFTTSPIGDLHPAALNPNRLALGSEGHRRMITGPGGPISSNEKTLYEGMNFFSNLYNNPDLEASLDVYRNRVKPGADGKLVSDPVFDIVRERGVARAIEAGRRLGGLQSSGTGRGVADFLTTAEAQQRTYEDERADTAADRLYQMLFARGQAAFLPTQTFASTLAGLGGSTQFAPTPTFGNAKGQAGQTAGAYLGSALRPSKTPTTSPVTVPGTSSGGVDAGPGEG